MPYVAIDDGEKKTPHEVPHGKDVECVECGERMRIWRRGEMDRPRRFQHVSNMSGGGGGSGCAGGGVAESPEHTLWKGWTADRLLQVFDDLAEANVEPVDEEQKREIVTESGVKAPASEKERRIGDVVVRFDEPDEQLGKGLIAEVQHKNHSKNRLLTAQDYIQQGYSLVWLEKYDFGSDGCLLAEADFRDRARQTARRVWPEIRRWEEHFEPHSCLTAKTRLNLAPEETITEVPAALPEEWFDRESRKIWNEKDWESEICSPNKLAEVHMPSAEHKRIPVKMPLADDVLRWWRSVILSTKGEPERPSNPFDDVQCRNCGMYWHHKKEHTDCPRCTTPVDWVWNLETDRIGRDALPRVG